MIKNTHSQLDEDYSPEQIQQDHGGSFRGAPVNFFKSSDYSRADKAAFKKAGYTYGYILIYGKKVPSWWKWA